MINLKDVSFSYVGSERESGIKNINLTVNEGEVVLLCGESGCGKTTVTRLINGLIPHYYEGQMSGEVLIGEQKIHELPLHETSRLVGSVFQNPRSQFFNVSTTGEIVFGCENMALPVQEIFARLDHTMRELKIESLIDRSIFNLSGGEKQKIACASVAASDPPIIVLDEPSSNLDTNAVEELRRLIEMWKSKGKTVVIAEHRLYYLKELIDRVIYMKDGIIAGEYTARTFRVLSTDDLARMGLRPLSLSDVVRKFRTVPESNETMTLSRFSYTYKHATRAALKMEDFSIPRNAIIAIVGKNGAGKSTFARCLCGLEKKFHGTVDNGNQTLGARQLLKKSYMVMQDVNHQLFTESVLDEVLLSMENAQEASAEHILDRFDLLPLKELHPMSLSGGQMQRVAIASAHASSRNFIIFDEPTSGLDLKHMREVSAGLYDLYELGKTVFVITHDLELILECCTHILPIENGVADNVYPLDDEGVNKVRILFLDESDVI